MGRRRLGLAGRAAAVAACAAAAIAACAAAGAAPQQGAPGSGAFWGKNSEGYWWYAKEPPATEKKKPEEKKPLPPAPAAKAEPPKTKIPEQPAEQPPKVGSFEWISENIKVYRKAAIDDPTVANVKAYLYVQRLAMDRAQQFAEAGKLAIIGDPLLDESANYPVQAGMTQNKRMAYISGETERLLKRMYKNTGMLFVFKNVCFLCDQQAEVLKIAEKQYGLAVQAVAVDEIDDRSTAAKLFPNYVYNPAAARELKVLALPSTFLYNGRTTELKPMLQGMMSLSDLTDRSITAARMYHWLPESEYAYIKPQDELLSLSGTLAKGSGLSSELEEYGGINPFGKNTNYIPPETLVKLIQDAKYKEIPADFVPRGY